MLPARKNETVERKESAAKKLNRCARMASTTEAREKARGCASLVGKSEVDGDRKTLYTALACAR